jgi:predicted nucleotidyltransferase
MSTDALAERLALPEPEVAAMVRQLADAGYLEHQDATWPESTDEWTTTVSGGALTMASFLRPMPRARADKLLAGVLERAEVYNADATKPYLITEITVFGSYLRPDVTELGDLDLAVKSAPREPSSRFSETVVAYARASGRQFSSFMDELAWAEVELRQVLRNRSGYINVHTEDISRFTDDWQVVYRYPVENADGD